MAMRSACGNGARLEQAAQLDALPLAFAEQRDHVGHGVDAPDQQFARDVDVGAVAQRARHDRLDHRKDVFDAMIELVDHGGEPALEADPYLDLAGQPQIVVGDIAEQAADDAGERKADGGDDRRGLLRAHRGVGLGVVAERPVAAAERHRAHDQRHRAAFPHRAGGDDALVVGDQLVVGLLRIAQHHREQRQIVIGQHQRRQFVGERDEAGGLARAVLLHRCGKHDADRAVPAQQRDRIGCDRLAGRHGAGQRRPDDRNPDRARAREVRSFPGCAARYPSAR